MTVATTTSTPAAGGGQDRLSQRNFQRLAASSRATAASRCRRARSPWSRAGCVAALRATGIADLSRYCDFLFEKDGLRREAIHLIDVMTTNKTEFFREPDHFRFLADQAVPRLLADPRGARQCVESLERRVLHRRRTLYAGDGAGRSRRNRSPDCASASLATDISTEVLDVADRAHLSGSDGDAGAAGVAPPLRSAIEGPLPPAGARSCPNCVPRCASPGST